MAGTFVVSIEVELGWGAHDLENFDHLSSNGVEERAYLERYLEIADRHSVPTTFNVVGELFDGFGSGKLDKSIYPNGWFDSERNQSGLFYNPGIVESIDAADIDHEVCTHTYSHILFDEMSREVAAADLQQAQRVHLQRYGTKTVSLVPPRHQEPEKDQLSNHDIEIVRVAQPQSSNTRVSRFWELLVDLPCAHAPQVVDGVVETYTSSYPSLTIPTLPRGKAHPPDVFKLLPTSFRERAYSYGIKRALDQASKQNEVVHLWCHIFDFCSKQQINHIDKIFKIIDQRQDVEIMTMDQLNQNVRSGFQ